MTCSGRGSFPVDDGASSGSKAGINDNLTSKFLALLAGRTRARAGQCIDGPATPL